jgi:hypothetical protein
VSVIHGGVAIRDFDMPPAFERREHHEEIGRAVALVFIIEPGRQSVGVASLPFPRLADRSRRRRHGPSALLAGAAPSY